MNWGSSDSTRSLGCLEDSLSLACACSVFVSQRMLSRCSRGCEAKNGPPLLCQSMYSSFARWKLFMRQWKYGRTGSARLGEVCGTHVWSRSDLKRYTMVPFFSESRRKESEKETGEYWRRRRQCLWLNRWCFLSISHHKAIEGENTSVRMCDAESTLFKRFYGNVLTTGCN
jgi:hypothetical protein